MNVDFVPLFLCRNISFLPVFSIEIGHAGLRPCFQTVRADSPATNCGESVENHKERKLTVSKGRIYMNNLGSTFEKLKDTLILDHFSDLHHCRYRTRRRLLDVVTLQQVSMDLGVRGSLTTT